MSLFLDNCVLCFQCTSIEDLNSTKDKKNAIWSCQIHSNEMARDQNPLHFLQPSLWTACQSLTFRKRSFVLRRAEWEYKSTTLLHSHQMVFFVFFMNIYPFTSNLYVWTKADILLIPNKYEYFHQNDILNIFFDFFCIFNRFVFSRLHLGVTKNTWGHKYIPKWIQSSAIWQSVHV